MASDPPDTLPDGYPLTDLYRKRVRQNQDLFIVLSDWHNRRGTGKSIASLRLAHVLDRTDAGLTSSKATLSVGELMDSYVDAPKGSALVLDEAEAGVSKYEAGSLTNRAFRKLVSMGRIEEKYVIANLPNSGQMDSDLKALADVWVLVTARGRAKVNILGYNPWGEHPIVVDDHLMHWDDVPRDHYLRDVYDDLTDDKRDRLRGTGGSHEVVKADEVEQRVDRAKEEAQREKRNEMLRTLYDDVQDMTQRELAQAAGISRSQVANILNGKA